MRDRALAVAVAVAHRVQRHALAVVESDAQRPVLPLQQVAVEGERRALGLGDVQRLERLPRRRRADALRNVPRHVFAHHVRGFDVRRSSSTRSTSMVLRSMTQCSPLTRWAYGFGAGRVLAPGVRPAEPPVAELGRRDRVAVGPGVHEDDVEVGDAPLGERGDHVGVRAQHLVALDELVDGEVGLHAGHVVERLDPVVAQRDDALVGGVGRPVQADRRSRGGRARRRSRRTRRSSALLGSTSSIEANRHPSPERRRPAACTSCSRRNTAATALNSSADSGSSGCVTSPLDHIDARPRERITRIPARTPQLRGAA